MKRIENDLPEGRERQIIGAMLELHLTLQGSVWGPDGLEKLATDKRFQAECIDRSFEWARRKFPGIKFWIE